MTKPRQSRYAEKRRLGLVPLTFSEPVRQLAAALQRGADDGELGPIRDAHDRQLWRVFGWDKGRRS